MFKTAITELFGIERPIIQGGMHYVGYAELSAAVSNAGGLGIITALTQPTPEDLRKEIKKCRTLTKKPFGVNLTLLPALVPPDYDSYVRVIVEEGVRIVETAGRNPEKLIKVLKQHNIVVIHKCVSVRHALSAQRMGVDAISMDGAECGGHPGEDSVGNWVLAVSAARQLKVPFVISGGCATGSQLAAALCLGAAGLNMGTRFMAVKEAPVVENVKQTLVKANEHDTTLVLQTLKNTERVFKNKAALTLQSTEKEFPGSLEKILPQVKGALYKEVFHTTGDTTNGIWSCGQSIGLIDSVPTCQELLDTIMQDAEAALLRTNKQYTKGIPSKL